MPEPIPIPSPEVVPEQSILRIRQNLLSHGSTKLDDYRTLKENTCFKGCDDAYRLPFSDCLAIGAFEKGSKIPDQLRAKSSKEGAPRRTEFGEALFRVLPHSTFVDLGCGDLKRSVMAREAAVMGGADLYIGVDNYDGFEEGILEHSGERGTTCAAIQGEILSTLAQMPEDTRTVIHMAGIELSTFAGQSQQYADACRAEMVRMKPRAIIIGPASTFFEPSKIGYEKLSEVNAHTPFIGTGYGKMLYTLWVPKDRVQEHRDALRTAMEQSLEHPSEAA